MKDTTSRAFVLGSGGGVDGGSAAHGAEGRPVRAIGHSGVRTSASADGIAMHVQYLLYSRVKKVTHSAISESELY